MRQLILYSDYFSHLLPDGINPEILGQLPSGDKIVLVEDYFSHLPWWGRQLWFHVQSVKFQSISEARKALRQPQTYWRHCSQNSVRRSELILQDLPQWTKKIERGNFGLFFLTKDTELIWSTEILPQIPAFQPILRQRKDLPSRAYLKLTELFEYHLSPPKDSEICLELGACPGGWTAVLQEYARQVIAVDGAPLAKDFPWKDNVKFMKADGFSLNPSDLGKIDWVLADIICEPKRALELVQKWTAVPSVKTVVTTVKFKGGPDIAIMNKLMEIRGAQACHLFSNKNEVTWWWQRPSS